MFCNRCGNTLYFRRIVYGEIAIPVECEELLGEETEGEIQDMGHAELLSVEDEYYECQDCGSKDIERDYEEKEETNEDV